MKFISIDDSTIPYSDLSPIPRNSNGISYPETQAGRPDDPTGCCSEKLPSSNGLALIRGLGAEGLLRPPKGGLYADFCLIG